MAHFVAAAAVAVTWSLPHVFRELHTSPNLKELCMCALLSFVFPPLATRWCCFVFSFQLSCIFGPVSEETNRYFKFKQFKLAQIKDLFSNSAPNRHWQQRRKLFTALTTNSTGLHLLEALWAHWTQSNRLKYSFVLYSFFNPHLFRLFFLSYSHFQRCILHLFTDFNYFC